MDDVHIHFWPVAPSQATSLDITHYGSKHFLTIIDWGPLSLPYGDHNFFYEWGLPLEILTNNDTAFTCKHFKNFSSNWGVRLWFRCTYAPTGNDIIERSHWSIKTIVARKQCPIPETVYRENVMPKDNNSPTMALAVVLCRYHTWIWDVNTTSPAEPQDNWEAYELGKNSSWEVHD